MKQGSPTARFQPYLHFNVSGLVRRKEEVAGLRRSLLDWLVRGHDLNLHPSVWKYSRELPTELACGAYHHEHQLRAHGLRYGPAATARSVGQHLPRNRL